MHSTRDKSPFRFQQETLQENLTATHAAPYFRLPHVARVNGFTVGSRWVHGGLQAGRAISHL